MWLFGLYANKRGNQIGIEEFKGIFQNLFPELCIYASKFVGDFDTSKDIVHDVLTQFWEENEKLQHKNLVKPYLYKAVKNRALNYSKREKRKSRLDEIFDLQNADHDLADDNDTISSLSFENLQIDLEKAVCELPEQRQIIFRMSRFQQMKHKEIAAELNPSQRDHVLEILEVMVPYIKN